MVEERSLEEFRELVHNIGNDFKTHRRSSTMNVLPLDERKRRSRNILFLALAILVIIWTIKLSFPQHTLASTYTSLTPTSSFDPAPSTPSSLPNTHGDLKSKPQNTIVPATSLTTPNSTKAAVIIETRFRSNLIPLILHFSTVLGPTWPILIYTSAESVGAFGASAALARYLHSGLIQIRILPQSVLFTNSDSVNAFMTKSWLWESLAPAEHVLIFQSDSMLCANAARSVEDYFMYDLVGAPIADHLSGKGYNGGLSLRRRSTIMRILGEWSWEETKKDGDRFEDQWFYNRMVEYKEQDQQQGLEPEDEGAIHLPSVEIARTFSVETIDYPHPLGVHQVHRWLKTQMLSLDEWCPEHKLCSTDYIVDTPS